MALGLIGILIPIVPTVPLLLLTGYLFAKGSKRLSDWFFSSIIYRIFVRDFIKSRSMPFKLKIVYLTYSTIFMGIWFFKIPSIYVKSAIAAFVAAQYYLLLFKIKNSVPERKGTLKRKMKVLVKKRTNNGETAK